MDVEDRLAFMSAKKAELRSIFENGVWQLELEPEKASEGRVLKARFVLKCVDDGKVGTKAKARLVLQGYSGPDLLSGSLETSSPTFNRTSRQVLLSIGVLKEWEFLCADVATAFLQDVPFSAGVLQDKLRDGWRHWMLEQHGQGDRRDAYLVVVLLSLKAFNTIDWQRCGVGLLVSPKLALSQLGLLFSSCAGWADR